MFVGIDVLSGVGVCGHNWGNNSCDLIFLCTFYLAWYLVWFWSGVLRSV